MIEVEVVSKRKEAEHICVFELARPDGAPLPAFSAGAHIDVHLPDGMVRQYSLCNHPHERHRYEIGVLKSSDSRGGSRAMHEWVQVGDRLRVGEPRNLFALVPDAGRSLLFAGGIGITPILCMAESLAYAQADFEVHYCARSPTRAAFLDRIRASAFAGRVHFHFSGGDPAARLNINRLLADVEPDTHLYVCGPSGFMEQVLSSAAALGWAAERLHREYFAAAPLDHDADGSFEVQINSTGQVFVIPADKTVLEVLTEQEIDIPFSCEQGVCGTCITGVLEGEPDHRDLFLTEVEQAKNDQFAPCCSRARSARLVLDI